MSGAFREECRSAGRFLCFSFPFESQVSCTFLLVQSPHSKCWVMTVRKRPSTLLWDCMSPLNVHQWQLRLLVLQGGMGMCWRRLHWGLGKHFFPSHPCAAGAVCYSEFCSPPGLGQLDITWLSILSCLLSFCFLYLQDRGNCVLKFLCHIPSFQYSACCTEGHGFPGLLAGTWFLFDAVSGFKDDFHFSVGTGYSCILGQGAEHADHYLCLTAPQKGSLAVQGSQRHVNWLTGQWLFLLGD